MDSDNVMPGSGASTRVDLLHEHYPQRFDVRLGGEVELSRQHPVPPLGDFGPEVAKPAKHWIQHDVPVRRLLAPVELLPFS
jgi:hypothetical protein